MLKNLHLNKNSNNILKLSLNYYTLYQLFDNNVHLGYYKNKEIGTSNIIRKVRQNVSIINLFKTILYLKIFYNNFINIFYNNHFVLLSDNNFFGRDLVSTISYFYKRYILYAKYKWIPGKISNFKNVEVLHKRDKLAKYKYFCEVRGLSKTSINKLLFNNLEKNSFKYIFPNFTYNLFCYNNFILKESFSKKLPLITFLDTDMCIQNINYIGIPGNNDSILSLIFYRNILINTLKFSIIKNIYLFFFLLRRHYYKNKIYNYKKLFIYYNFYNYKF